MDYKCKSPVLFLVFNRPDVTRRVFEAIRAAQPPQLFVAADGPRSDRIGEVENCQQVRKIATSIDWECEVKTLFRDKNLGCFQAVSRAITWFFENVEEGIILEDDCLPNVDFFRFCDIMLQKYSEIPQVMAVTGSNYQRGKRFSNYSYYFSKYPHCWGWASWRRAWNYFDSNLKFWPAWVDSPSFKSTHEDQLERDYYKNVIARVKTGEIDSWAYRWTVSVNYHSGLTATPKVNLVKNIGYGDNATHTKGRAWYLGLEAEQLGNVVHPPLIEQDAVADFYVFEHVLGGRKKRFPWVLYWKLRQLVKRLIF